MCSSGITGPDQHITAVLRRCKTEKLKLFLTPFPCKSLRPTGPRAEVALREGYLFPVSCARVLAQSLPKGNTAQKTEEGRVLRPYKPICRSEAPVIHYPLILGSGLPFPITSLPGLSFAQWLPGCLPPKELRQVNFRVLDL